MPKFAANLTMLFTEVPFLDRFEAAAKAGFRAVEFLFPYEYPEAELARLLKLHSLELALINAPAGDWQAGERGLAALPGREDEFRAGIDTAIRYLKALGGRKLHVMSGTIPAGRVKADLTPLWLDNMRFAADRLAEHGFSLLCESLNPRNMPGYFLTSQHETADLVRAIGRANARLQFDVYHAQITDGDLSMTITGLGDLIGHVQIASVPNRNEPDTGEVFYPHIFRVLDQIRYNDWIGCEYNPRTRTPDGLGWLAAYGS